MKYVTSPANNLEGYQATAKKQPIARRFLQWANGQEAEHHIAWAGVSVISMAAVLFPLSMTVILMNGASFPLIITSMISLVLVVVLNLAAMPTRYTIPAFLLGALIDGGVIVLSLLML